MDPMDFIKQAWSSFNIPTPFAPTLNLEDLDKRIADLHAVEQWLALNQGMLRNTIQGLEIQRAALGAVQDFAAGLGAGQAAADDRFEHSMAQAAAAAAQQAEMARRARATGDSSSTPNAARDSGAGQDDAASGATEDARNTEASAASPDASPAPTINPVAWWSMMQTGFREMANAAMQSSTAQRAAFQSATSTPPDQTGASAVSNASPAALKPRRTPKAAKKSAKSELSKQATQSKKHGQSKPPKALKPSRHGKRSGERP